MYKKNIFEFYEEMQLYSLEHSKLYLSESFKLLSSSILLSSRVLFFRYLLEFSDDCYSCLITYLLIFPISMKQKQHKLD